MGMQHHSGMLSMSACIGGFMGQPTLRLTGEMPPPPLPDLGAGPVSEELPQVVQRLFAAYEHHPCVPVLEESFHSVERMF